MEDEYFITNYRLGEVIPWDLRGIFTNTLEIFESLGDGPNIGRTAKYVGIGDSEFDQEDFVGQVGEIVGDLYGRFVMDVEDGYLGWLNPEEIQFVNYVEPEHIQVH